MLGWAPRFPGGHLVFEIGGFWEELLAQRLIALGLCLTFLDTGILVNFAEVKFKHLSIFC